MHPEADDGAGLWRFDIGAVEHIKGGMNLLFDFRKTGPDGLQVLGHVLQVGFPTEGPLHIEFADFFTGAGDLRLEVAAVAFGTGNLAFDGQHFVFGDQAFFEELGEHGGFLAEQAQPLEGGFPFGF